MACGGAHLKKAS